LATNIAQAVWEDQALHYAFTVKIPALVNARLPKPLGNPAQNSAKYFSTADVLETAKDRAWLVKMSNAISQH